MNSSPPNKRADATRHPSARPSAALLLLAYLGWGLAFAYLNHAEASPNSPLTQGFQRALMVCLVLFCWLPAWLWWHWAYIKSNAAETLAVMTLGLVCLICLGFELGGGIEAAINALSPQSFSAKRYGLQFFMTVILFHTLVTARPLLTRFWRRMLTKN
jgi:hypothetical protein